jgi:beta-N-acetylhexosaminidase
VAGLSTVERVGQLLMVGVAVDAPSGLQDTVARYHLGGVFLHGRSTQSADRLHAGIKSLQRSARVPLLISLDQEGGEVQTLKGPDFPILPTAQKLGARSPGEIASVTAGSARRLAGIGVTLNLAPVADTVPASLGRGNPPIGAFHREYGTSPGTVAAAIRAVVPASQSAGVLTTLKHFPGLGRVRENTDTSTGAVDDTVTADDAYLEPFVTGVRAGSAAVMISSARYPKLDADNVAAFSKPIITGLLRDRLGFTGLVVSDDLGAAVAVDAVRVGQRAVRFVEAGGDMVLTIRPPDAAAMAGALMDQVRKDPAFAARVAQAATHVVQAKQRAGLLTCGH